MTPKEKARELANKFILKSVFDMTDEELKEQRKQGKAFAIIHVEELLKSTFVQNNTFNYWSNVIDEIKLL